MKCPKCDYLGFETGDRCKNCGYDFSLLASPEPEPADLSLTLPTRDDVPVGELWLAHSTATPQSTESQDALSSLESFPLFSPAGAGDEPLIRTPSEPRAPLAVRRSSDLSRSRSGRGHHARLRQDSLSSLRQRKLWPIPFSSFRSEVVTPSRPEVVTRATTAGGWADVCVRRCCGRSGTSNACGTHRSRHSARHRCLRVLLDAADDCADDGGMAVAAAPPVPRVSGLHEAGVLLCVHRDGRPDDWQDGRTNSGGCRRSADHGSGPCHQADVDRRCFTGNAWPGVDPGPDRPRSACAA